MKKKRETIKKKKVRLKLAKRETKKKSHPTISRGSALPSTSSLAPFRTWQIDVRNSSRNLLCTVATVRALAQDILYHQEALSRREYRIPSTVHHLSILLVNDKEIHRLNLAYRNKDKPTDVLSFSLLEGEHGALVPTSLGDIVISIPTTKRQAKEYRVTEMEEFTRLLIHGILHLIGYDHEGVTKAKAQQMRLRERRLWKLVKQGS